MNEKGLASGKRCQAFFDKKKGNRPVCTIEGALLATEMSESRSRQGVTNPMLKLTSRPVLSLKSIVAAESGS